MPVVGSFEWKHDVLNVGDKVSNRQLTNSSRPGIRCQVRGLRVPSVSCLPARALSALRPEPQR